jgi:FKBP-type peptidyl-prolyl cis-trans isomerase
MVSSPSLIAGLVGLAVFAGAGASPDQNIAWLAENAQKEGVITLPSGLQYKILSSGPESGQQPKAADECTCHYEGTYEP